MKLHRYFVSPLLAGALLGFPAQGLAHDNVAGPMNRGSSAVERIAPDIATEKTAQQTNPAEPFEVAIAYCQLGSIVDGTTGEIMDLYSLCKADAENLEIA